jgi:hypothetical protein
MIPRYLTQDPPIARRIRARLRHDRALTQSYRNLCFSRDQNDYRFAADPFCFVPACRAAEERETGRHAVVDCPAVAAEVAGLIATLQDVLGRVVDREELWPLLLGVCPDGADQILHDHTLSSTADYLIGVSEGRSLRDRRLLPLAYRLRDADRDDERAVDAEEAEDNPPPPPDPPDPAADPG